MGLFSSHTKPTTAAEIEAARAKALRHVERRDIFSILAERPACPTEVQAELDLPLHIVTYHVKWLAGEKKANRIPLIELVETDNRKGGTQHIYKAIEVPLVDMETAAKLGREEREGSTSTITQRIESDFEESRQAGITDDHEQRTLLRWHRYFDDQAYVESAELMERVREELKDIAARSANRGATEKTPQRPTAMALAVFPVPRIYGGSGIEREC